MISEPPLPARNRLLARLPRDDYSKLLPRMQLVSLGLRQILFEARSSIDQAYFPISGVVCALISMQNGSSIEVASIGSEGMVGCPAFLRAETSLTQVVVQVAGHAFRMRADVLKEEAAREGPFRRLLLSYQSAFLCQVSQGVACNGLHTVQQRCCRWLLMTQDRVQNGALSLTHDLLGLMLGVRRASISEVLRPLQERGLIRSRRGKIAILDRAGLEGSCCECYQTLNKEFDRLLGPKR
jgi:CRP-like cAMP-binding protein